MLQRGLLPDFSAEVIAADQLHRASAAAASDPSLRDLRRLLWASIDNDDSLDLDQLSVAEQLPDGAVKILVAIADVDAIVKKGSAIDDHARTNTTSVYTAAQIFPMLPEKLSTDLTSLADGKERLAIVIEMEVERRRRGREIRHLSGGGGESREARLQQRRRLARWNRARAGADLRGSRPRSESALAGSSRAGDESAAASAWRADAGDDRGAAGVRRRFAGRSASGPEESRDRADRRLHDRRQRRDWRDTSSRKASRRCAESCARPSVGRESSSWRGTRAEVFRRVPNCRALQEFLEERRTGGSRALSGPVAFGRQAAGPRRIRGRVPRPASGGTLWSRGERLHPFDRAQPAFPRPDHAAPVEGGALRDARARTAPTSSTIWPGTAPTRKTTRPRWNGRCGSRRRRCCSSRASASGSTRSSRALPRRGPGCESTIRRRRAES